MATFDFSLDSGSGSAATFDFGGPATGSAGDTAPPLDITGGAGGFSIPAFSLPGAAEEKKGAPAAADSAAGGFNFGADASSFALPDSSSGATTDTTAAAGGFDFAALGATGAEATTAATGASSSATGATAPADAAAPGAELFPTQQALGPDATSRIKDMTVEEIIGLWNQDLEEHMRSFTEQAMEVKKWDEQLLDNGQKITELQGNVKSVQSQQRTLNRLLDTIKTSQEDLNNLISAAERELEQQPRAKPTEDELKREDAYRMAEDIDAELVQMSDSLREAVERLNHSSQRSMDQSPLAQIVEILNIQMNSLQWVERNSKELDQKITVAATALKSKESDQAGNY